MSAEVEADQQDAEAEADELEASSLPPDPDIVSTPELAARLRISVMTVQSLRDKGVISYMDTGGADEFGGGAIRYSYSLVKQQLTENAEQRRRERLARKQEYASGRIAEVVQLLDAAIDEGQLPDLRLISQRWDVGAKTAKDLFAQAAQEIVKRDGLLTRTMIADENTLDVARVVSLMRREDAPKPVLKVGKLLYYRPDEVTRLLQAAGLAE